MSSFEAMGSTMLTMDVVKAVSKVAMVCIMGMMFNKGVLIKMLKFGVASSLLLIFVTYFSAKSRFCPFCVPTLYLLYVVYMAGPLCMSFSCFVGRMTSVGRHTSLVQ